MNRVSDLTARVEVTGRTRSIARGLAAVALGALRNENPDRICDRARPHDHMAGIVTRAAVSPTKTDDLAESSANGFVLFSALAPGSLISKIAPDATELDLTGVHAAIVTSATMQQYERLLPCARYSQVGVLAAANHPA